MVQTPKLALGTTEGGRVTQLAQAAQAAQAVQEAAAKGAAGGAGAMQGVRAVMAEHMALVQVLMVRVTLGLSTGIRRPVCRR